MYTLSISNSLGVEAWNSYSNPYPRNLELRVAVDTAAIITNEFNEIRYSNTVQSFPAGAIPYAASTWKGYNPAKGVTGVSYSFQLPLRRDFMFLTNATYRDNLLAGDRQYADGASGALTSHRFVVESGNFESHAGQPHFTVPHWWFQMKTRLRFYLVDTTFDRIVDYVNIESTEDPIYLTDILMRNNTTDASDFCSAGQPYSPNNSKGAMWCTNRWPNVNDPRFPTFGILNQWKASCGDPSAKPNDANSFIMTPVAGLDENGSYDHFLYQFGFSPKFYPNKAYSKTNIFYAPITPSRTIYYFTTWQVNDPLVHYTIGDLTPLGRTNRWDFTTSDSSIANLGLVNQRYQPWAGNPNKPGAITDFDPTVKDPLVFLSQDWDFPTNRFPSIGWLGRVHRGTPWQTIYLKYTRTPIGQADPNLLKWKTWTGNGQWVRNVGQIDTNVVQPFWNNINNPANAIYVPDAAFTHPVYDRYIVDLFTASTSDNIARGQLSINQTNLAAWSAVLSGVVVLTNSSTASDLAKPSVQHNPAINPYVIDPAGTYDAFNTNTWPQLVGLVRAINSVRATNNNLGVFTRLGDILSVRDLTLGSPFLNTSTNGAYSPVHYGISEAAYERIPQQILGLLQCEPAPRFVIYSYGQALKPADKSLITASGPYFQLCTNYQVVAEAATRTVVRIEGTQYRFPSTWSYVAPGRVIGIDDSSVPNYSTNVSPHRYPYPGTSTNMPAYNKLRAVIESYNVMAPD